MHGLHFSSRKPHFDGAHNKKPQPIKTEICETQLQWICLKTALNLKLKEQCGRGGRQIARARVSGFRGEIVYPSDIRTTSVKSHPCDCPFVRWARTPSNMPSSTRKGPRGLRSKKKKNYRQLNKAKSGELVLPSKEHMNWLSIANLSALRTTK